MKRLPGGAILCLVMLVAANAFAAAPRVLSKGSLPEDARLKPPKDLDGYFPFTPPAKVEQWNARAEQVRRQMLVANGLWPMPAKTPLNAVIHGRVDRPEYTIEKVYFESYPGFFVTGSLYRPKNVTGKVPVVLVPHGHHNNGRFNEESVQSARNQIAEGAERWENGGRYPLQAMCVTLARMGCIAFHYDMVGYADSTQLSFDLVHRFDVPNGAVLGPREAGFFSLPAELQCQSPMGLQTYNSLRAVDFVCEFPDVDSTRIGVTGASGGGTQTMILAALEPRISAAAPVVMVSTAMQGGCTCENCSLLRIDTGNIEFAALCAPRPQLIISANDWTKELGTKGLPELQEHYKLLGSPDNLTAKLNLHFPHNYNFVSREAMYQFFNQHLKLGLPSPVLEEDFQPLSVVELSVWDESHPKPPGGDAFERSFCQQLAAESAKQIAALIPADGKDLSEYRRVAGGAWEVLLGGGVPDEAEIVARVNRLPGEFELTLGELRRDSIGSHVPFVMLAPLDRQIRGCVLWLDGAGKSALFAEDGKPTAEVRNLLDAKLAVVGVDLFLQGEFLVDGKAPTEIQRVNNPRKFLGYTLGYNHASFSQRVRDVLSLAAYLKAHEVPTNGELDLVATGSAGKYAAAALAVSGTTFDRAVIDTAGFRFANLKSLWDIDMLPGAVKYGDLPGMLSLSQAKQLWIAGEGSTPPSPFVPATLFDGPVEKRQAAAVDWLIEK